MNVEQILNKLTSRYPLDLAEEWDNCGLQLGSLKQNVKKVLVTLDITREVVLEAVNSDVDLIISHHPLLFRPIQRVQVEDYTGRLIYTLIEHQISVLSLHTNFDNADGGMNSILLRLLGGRNERTVDYNNSIRIGSIPRTEITNLLKQYQEILPVPFMRYSGKENALVETIGVIGGSGSSPQLFEALIANQDVDLFITGDTKSYEARFAKENGLNVLDISHNNELVFNQKIKEDLEDTELEVLISEIDTEAYIYHF